MTLSNNLETKIISLAKPITFVGFRNFYYYKLPKKHNQIRIQRKVDRFASLFSENKITYDKIYESMHGAFTYLAHANTYKLRLRRGNNLEKTFPKEISYIEVNRILSISRQTFSLSN